MLPQRLSFNPKRRICPAGEVPAPATIAVWRKDLHYAGNPEHKRNPGDFGLSPPAGPRPGKTLCDTIHIFKRSEAAGLLKEGLQRALFSRQQRDGWPQNIWAVTGDGSPVEAQMEAPGRYHGYPMPENDPFRDIVLAKWASSEGPSCKSN